MCNNNPLGNITSRAASIRSLNGKQVVRVIGGMATIEDIPEYKAKVEKFVKEYFGPDAILQEDESKYYYKHRFWLKPKMHRITQGEINFRSKDFFFVDNGNKVYGDLKDNPDELVGSETKWYEKGFIRIFKHPLGNRGYVYQLKE